MVSKINNEYGVITIDNEVIARIAGLAAMDCCGIVGMAANNVKDGIVQLLRKESLAKGVQVSLNENGLTVGLHIIVEYGTNITAIAETLISNVKYKVEEYTGISVCGIKIHVDGIRVN